MASIIRAKVSKKKKRFQKDGFDLDLSYITDRVIAMGCPSESIEAIYRNPISEVKRFFDTYHKDRYHFINLCSERAYNIKRFDGRVLTIPFDDHNCPAIEQIEEFVEGIENWLSTDPKNVVAVHCKAGKGRTGLMLCCWMLYAGMWTTAEEALGFFGFVRCSDEKGVTIPSQKRTVGYFEELLSKGPKPKVTLSIKQIQWNTIPTIESGSYMVFAVVKVINSSMQTIELCTTKEFELNKDINGDPGFSFDLPQVEASGSVKIEFWQKKIINNVPLFRFWFHTSFVKDNALVIPKQQLDVAYKDKRYPDNFSVQVKFDTLHISSTEVVGRVAAKPPPEITERRRAETYRSASQKLESARSQTLFILQMLENTLIFLCDTVCQVEFLYAPGKREILKEISNLLKKMSAQLSSVPAIPDHKTGLHPKHTALLIEANSSQGSVQYEAPLGTDKEAFIVQTLRKVIIKVLDDVLNRLNTVRVTVNALAQVPVETREYAAQAGKVYNFAISLKKLKEYFDEFQANMGSINERYYGNQKTSVINFCEQIAKGTREQLERDEEENLSASESLRKDVISDITLLKSLTRVLKSFNSNPVASLKEEENGISALEMIFQSNVISIMRKELFSGDTLSKNVPISREEFMNRYKSAVSNPNELIAKANQIRLAALNALDAIEEKLLNLEKITTAAQTYDTINNVKQLVDKIREITHCLKKKTGSGV